MKHYAIILTEDDLTLLDQEDYSCVEVVVEKILEQAKTKGYVSKDNEESA